MKAGHSAECLAALMVYWLAEARAETWAVERVAPKEFERAGLWAPALAVGRVAPKEFEWAGLWAPALAAQRVD